MRLRPSRRVILPLVALALALVGATPAGAADDAHGATVGLNLGYVAPGVWDLYRYAHPGGDATLALSWSNLPFPPADYDLHLYAPHALDDGMLLPEERIADSSTRTFAPHDESIALALPAARYVVAVVPFQTQGEIYTLESGSGDLAFAALAPGVIAHCPPFCSG